MPVRVPVRLEVTGGTGVLTEPQRLLRRDATGRTLLGRPSRINRHEVRPLALTLVFEHRVERSPRGRRGVAAVRRLLHHLLRVQVFNRNEIVLPSGGEQTCVGNELFVSWKDTVGPQSRHYVINERVR